jgi:Ras-related protein Rab-7A
MLGTKTMPHFLTSAKEALQVDAAFYEAAVTALKKETPDSQIFIPETINLSASKKEPVAKKSGCC